MKQKTLLAGLLAAMILLPVGSWCGALKDYQTTPTAEEAGDTVITYQVSCPVQPGTLNNAQIVGNTTTWANNVAARRNRRRMICNNSSFKIYIGSNTTTLATTGFIISESTGTFPCLADWGSANLYCTALSTGTITVLENDNSK